MIARFFDMLSTLMKKLCANFSGASLKVLDACEQDGDVGEYSSYVKLGIMMLLLACLSGASGAYAIFTVCNNLQASAIFGVFWGVLILSLDRLIVATWSLARSFGVNVLLIGSRFALSLLIGFLISYPAELAIFRPEIKEMLVREQIEAGLKENAHIENDPTRKAEREALQLQEKPLREEIATMRQEVQRLYEEFKNEAEGTGGTMRFGPGPVAKQKEERYREYKDQCAAIEKQDKAQIAAIETELAQSDRAKKKSLAEKDSAQKQATGLLARASALHRLMAERPVIAWIKWGITLVLVLLETLPMMVKLHASLSGKSAYEAKQGQAAAERQHQQDLLTAQQKRDAEQQKQNHEADLEAQRQAAAQYRAMLAHAHQTELQKRDLLRQAELQQLQDEQDLARQQAQDLQTDVAAYSGPLVAQHMKDIMGVAMDKWADEQKAAINANPTQYQKTP